MLLCTSINQYIFDLLSN